MMPSSPLPEPDDAGKDARRPPGASYSRLVAAAIRVFGDRGFAHSTVRDICAAAEVSRPMFYRHFENKQDAFEVVVGELCDTWAETLARRAADFDGHALEALQAVFLESLEFCRSRPLIQKLLTRDSQVMLWSESGLFERATVRLWNLNLEILNRGVAAGEVRSDVSTETLADALTEINFAYMNRQLVTGTALDDASGRGIAAFIVGGVMGRAEPGGRDGTGF